MVKSYKKEFDNNRKKSFFILAIVLGVFVFSLLVYVSYVSASTTASAPVEGGGFKIAQTWIYNVFENIGLIRPTGPAIFVGTETSAEWLSFYNLRATLGVETCTPVDGDWTEWTNSGPCSATCGASSCVVSGTRPQSRSCTNPSPSCGGADCVGSTNRSVSCSITCNPPVDGDWSGWTSGECSASCGTNSCESISGTVTSTKSCTNPSPSCGGADCVGSTNKTESCSVNCGTCSGECSWCYDNACRGCDYLYGSMFDVMIGCVNNECHGCNHRCGGSAGSCSGYETCAYHGWSCLWCN